MSGFLLYGGMMKSKTVIVTDEQGKQYVIPGVNTAVSMLNRYTRKATSTVYLCFPAGSTATRTTNLPDTVPR